MNLYLITNELKKTTYVVADDIEKAMNEYLLIYDEDKIICIQLISKGIIIGE